MSDNLQYESSYYITIKLLQIRYDMIIFETRNTDMM